VGVSAGNRRLYPESKSHNFGAPKCSKKAMDKIFESISISIVPVVLAICYTIYSLAKLKRRGVHQEELKKWHELLEKGMITQSDYDTKKQRLLRE
jgi:heme/copper-type cytochrome/quinol oxidase subunit 2